MLWSSVIDVVRGSLFVLAHWCGGSFGAAIIVASMVTRLALLPLTLRAARRRHKRPRAPKPHFRTCRSPKTYKHLPPGRYRFTVRAVGAGGTDLTPARRTFRIP